MPDRPERGDEHARKAWWKSNLLAACTTHEGMANSAASALALRDRRIAELDGIVKALEEDLGQLRTVCLGECEPAIDKHLCDEDGLCTPCGGTLALVVGLDSADAVAALRDEARLLRDSIRFYGPVGCGNEEDTLIEMARRLKVVSECASSALCLLVEGVDALPPGVAVRLAKRELGAVVKYPDETTALVQRLATVEAEVERLREERDRYHRDLMFAVTGDDERVQEAIAKERARIVAWLRKETRRVAGDGTYRGAAWADAADAIEAGEHEEGE